MKSIMHAACSLALFPLPARDKFLVFLTVHCGEWQISPIMAPISVSYLDMG